MENYQTNDLSRLAPVTVCDISVVIPVKNNAIGLEALLESFLNLHITGHVPSEIWIVDNGSIEPLANMDFPNKFDLPINLLFCKEPGAGAARNMGVEASSGSWVLFIDSDCVVTTTTITGYLSAGSDCIAYTGIIETPINGGITRYHELQQTFTPPFQDQPEYVVTANCLVNREVFKKLGGFSNTYKTAAGEDVDLGYRLRTEGKIGVSNSRVLHLLEDNFLHFVERFFRYGRASYYLVQSYGDHFKPVSNRIKHADVSMRFLAWAQFQTERVGYHFEMFIGRLL